MTNQCSLLSQTGAVRDKMEYISATNVKQFFTVCRHVAYSENKQVMVENKNPPD